MQPLILTCLRTSYQVICYFSLKSTMRLVLAGGFLGSGKTTAITNAARLLIKDGKNVAVITNDQGEQQVDSAYISSLNIPFREVANGCFCCNYQRLDEHIEELKKNEPYIVFAESVGSCTDLIATIVKPMSKFKPQTDVVVSIFADAALVSSVLAGQSSFLDDTVRYIYKKQLEEADILVLNKIDLVSAGHIEIIDETIQAEYPGKIILHQNSKDDHQVARWLETIIQFTDVGQRKTLDIDYNMYGAGEAQLAWLDKTINITSKDGNAVFLVEHIIRFITHQIQSNHIAIGHLKFFVESDGVREKISITATSTGSDIRIFDAASDEASVLINARVETNPSILEKIVDKAVTYVQARFDCNIVSGKWSVFKPGFPRPTHRILE
jgi:G3E family GTPase